MDIKQLEEIKIGTVLHDSWGYDMTINEFAKVIQILPKSFRCVMIGKQSITEKNELTELDTKRVIPNKEHTEGKPFLVFKKYPKDRSAYPNEVWLSGSFPYVIQEDGTEYKKEGNWRVAKDGDSFYENHDD